MPLHCLVSPPEGYGVRAVDDKHFRGLEKEITENPQCNFTMSVGFVRNSSGNVTMKQINNGEHNIYILGGNHSILARQSVMNSDIYSCDPKYEHLNKVKVRVYGDLTCEEGLHVGTQHNKIHTLVKAQTFEDDIKLFRQLLFEAGGKKENEQEDPPEGAEVETNWRELIRNILGLKSVRYRIEYNRIE